MLRPRAFGRGPTPEPNWIAPQLKANARLYDSPENKRAVEPRANRIAAGSPIFGFMPITYGTCSTICSA